MRLAALFQLMGERETEAQTWQCVMFVLQRSHLHTSLLPSGSRERCGL